MKRYSKPVYQGRRLRRMVELAEKSAEMPAREATSLPKPSGWTVGYHPKRSPNWYRRTAMVPRPPSYGDTMNSARAAFKLLHEHSVAMRNQGLVGGDVAIATELYQSGATLAQLGDDSAPAGWHWGMGTKPRS